MYKTVFNTNMMSATEKEIYNKQQLLERKTIINYEILVKNKVLIVYFKDGKSEKMVCHEQDSFDLHKGLYLAIAKHLYKNIYTLEGVEKKAEELSYTKEYIKIVKKAIKNHEISEREKTEYINKLKTEKEMIHKKKMKADKEKRERRIEIQKEAYLRAMREFKEEKRMVCEANE